LLVLYARTSEHNKYIVRLANKLSDMHGLRSPCMRSAVLALRGPMLAVYPQASIRHLAGRGPDSYLVFVISSSNTLVKTFKKRLIKTSVKVFGIKEAFNRFSLIATYLISNHVFHPFFNRS
jgi:hypothetical protein